MLGVSVASAPVAVANFDLVSVGTRRVQTSVRGWAGVAAAVPELPVGVYDIVREKDGVAVGGLSIVSNRRWRIWGNE